MSNRCLSRHPDTGMRCVNTVERVHEYHAAWNREEQRVEWKDAPAGPQTPDEFMAAAWELTGGLGLEIAYNPAYEILAVKPSALAEWWDGQDTDNLMRAWRIHATATR